MAGTPPTTPGSSVNTRRDPRAAAALWEFHPRERKTLSRRTFLGIFNLCCPKPATEPPEEPPRAAACPRPGGCHPGQLMPWQRGRDPPGVLRAGGGPGAAPGGLQGRGGVFGHGHGPKEPSRAARCPRSSGATVSAGRRRLGGQGVPPSCCPGRGALAAGGRGIPWPSRGHPPHMPRHLQPSPGHLRASPGIPRASPAIPRASPGTSGHPPGISGHLREPPGIPRASPGISGNLRESPGHLRASLGTPGSRGGVRDPSPLLPRLLGVPGRPGCVPGCAPVVPRLCVPPLCPGCAPVCPGSAPILPRLCPGCAPVVPRCAPVCPGVPRFCPNSAPVVPRLFHAHRQCPGAAFCPLGELWEGQSLSLLSRFSTETLNFSSPQGCSCGLGLTYPGKSCTMPPVTFQDLPLNIYMLIFGTGAFIFVLSLILCCYFIGKLRHQARSERFGYQEVKPGLLGGHSGDRSCPCQSAGTAGTSPTLPGTNPRAHPAPSRPPPGRSWCEILVGDPGVRSWCEILVGDPGGRSWCEILV
uniref:Uncharacterized protein n=1 Tax=Taeniopygia guttata TaxID=59729 RepID=A0A674H4S8_TAEGU